MTEQQINLRLLSLNNDHEICKKCINELSLISGLSNILPALNFITKTKKNIEREIDLLTQIIKKNDI